MLEAVLNQTSQRRSLGPGAIASIAIHAGVLGGAIYLSAQGTRALVENPKVVTFFNATPAPPPPPPPAGGGATKHSTPKKVVHKPDTLLKTDKPVEKAEPAPEPEAPSESAGVAGGVKGGVEGGTLGGTQGGTLGGTLGGQPGAPPPPTNAVLPFGAGMTRPSLLSKRDPVYPREAAVAKIGGLMLVKCVITAEGSLKNCRVVKGLPFMDQPVLAALSSWKYTPIQYQGRAVSVEYVIPVRLVPP
jgi:protein TonB